MAWDRKRTPSEPPTAQDGPDPGGAVAGSNPRLVLFLCVENSCRSLMAEAAFNGDSPAGWTGVSAGTAPSAAANPRTAAMLREVGLELPRHPPQPIAAGLLERASVRVTMGCLDDASCPARLATLPVRDWALPDPARLDDAGFRRVRDEILRRVGELRAELVRSAPTADRRRGR